MLERTWGPLLFSPSRAACIRFLRIVFRMQLVHPILQKARRREPILT